MKTLICRLCVEKGWALASPVSAWSSQEGREPAANNTIEKYCILDTGIGPLVGMSTFFECRAAIGQVEHTRLRLHSRYRRCKRRADYDGDLIKEKIALSPIQIDGFWGCIMTIGMIPFIIVELILALSVCWVTGGQINGFEHQPIKQGNFLKKYHWPIQIRPPPITAFGFNVFCTMMYS